MYPAILDMPRQRHVNKPKSDGEFAEIREFGLLNHMLARHGFPTSAR
jgi:hypothetical protein